MKSIPLTVSSCAELETFVPIAASATDPAEVVAPTLVPPLATLLEAFEPPAKILTIVT